MASKFLVSSVTIAATLLLLSCKKDAATSPGTCYTGQVVALTCVNGVLIDVDARFPIGRPTSRNTGTGPVFLGNNVIAVSNSRDIINMGGANTSGTNNIAGQRLYFSAEPDSLMPGLGCYANDGVINPVPAMRLSNVSTTACVPMWQ